MNLHTRAELVRAMELLVRSINDEEIIMSWLSLGVADGDINGNETDDDLEWYCEEDTDFAELMALFLRLMVRADADGGLYADGVCSEDIEKNPPPFEKPDFLQWVEEYMDNYDCGFDVAAREYNALFNPSYDPEDYEDYEDYEE